MDSDLKTLEFVAPKIRTTCKDKYYMICMYIRVCVCDICLKTPSKNVLERHTKIYVCIVLQILHRTEWAHLGMLGLFLLRKAMQTIQDNRNKHRPRLEKTRRGGVFSTDVSQNFRRNSLAELFGFDILNLRKCASSCFCHCAVPAFVTHHT